MIDWHSHILPNMDDGSRDAAESQMLLQMLSKQNVDTVVATPHFFASRESVRTFLQRREQSYEALIKNASSVSRMPDILLGAEVKYYPGISAMEDLCSLCIEGTRLLLLEMPHSEWSEYTIKELEALAYAKGLTVVLAHIERYFSHKKEVLWSRLRDSGILMQVNASYFADFGTKRKALRLLENGMVHMIGSDCHNMTSRPPLITRAYDVIRKKFGDEWIDQMCVYGRSLLV